MNDNQPISPVLPLLDNLLTYFSPNTISKSKSYVKQVTHQNTQINVFAYKEKAYKEKKESNALGLLLQTEIKGSVRRPYKVQVIFDVNIHVLDTECSCPVAYDCKHTAAAVQGVYKNGLLYDAVSALYEVVYGGDSQDPATLQALSWIDGFQHTLSHLSRSSGTSELANIHSNTDAVALPNGPGPHGTGSPSSSPTTGARREPGWVSRCSSPATVTPPPTATPPWWWRWTVG